MCHWHHTKDFANNRDMKSKRGKTALKSIPALLQPVLTVFATLTKLKNLRQFIEVVISICQIFELTLANFIFLWANFNCCKWHLVTPVTAVTYPSNLPKSGLSF